MNDEQWTNKINRINYNILDSLDADYYRPIIDFNIKVGNKDEKMRKRCWYSIVSILDLVEGALLDSGKYNVRDELGRFTKVKQ